MKVSGFVRGLVGVGTLLYALSPLVAAGLWALLAFGVPLGLAFAAWQQGQAPDLLVFPLFISGLTLPVQCLLLPFAVALTAFYLTHLIRNREGLELYRILLGLGFVFLPFLAMPVYYLLYVWPAQPPAWACEPTGR